MVSRGGPERGILDAGSKGLTSDTGWDLDGHGHILEHLEQTQAAGKTEQAAPAVKAVAS